MCRKENCAKPRLLLYNIVKKNHFLQGATFLQSKCSTQARQRPVSSSLAAANLMQLIAGPHTLYSSQSHPHPTRHARSSRLLMRCFIFWLWRSTYPRCFLAGLASVACIVFSFTGLAVRLPVAAFSGVSIAGAFWLALLLFLAFGA